MLSNIYEFNANRISVDQNVCAYKLKVGVDTNMLKEIVRRIKSNYISDLVLHHVDIYYLVYETFIHILIKLIMIQIIQTQHLLILPNLQLGLYRNCWVYISNTKACVI